MSYQSRTAVKLLMLFLGKGFTISAQQFLRWRHACILQSY